MNTSLIFAEIVVAPPAPYLEYVKARLPAQVGIAAQNCYKEASGAFTGEIRYDYRTNHKTEHGSVRGNYAV